MYFFTQTKGKSKLKGPKEEQAAGALLNLYRSIPFVHFGIPIYIVLRFEYFLSLLFTRLFSSFGAFSRMARGRASGSAGGERYTRVGGVGGRRMSWTVRMSFTVSLE